MIFNRLSPHQVSACSMSKSISYSNQFSNGTEGAKVASLDKLDVRSINELNPGCKTDQNDVNNQNLTEVISKTELERSTSLDTVTIK